jgi:hypothetical protein
MSDSLQFCFASDNPTPLPISETFPQIYKGAIAPVPGLPNTKPLSQTQNPGRIYIEGGIIAPSGRRPIILWPQGQPLAPDNMQPPPPIIRFPAEGAFGPKLPNIRVKPVNTQTPEPVPVKPTPDYYEQPKPNPAPPAAILWIDEDTWEALENGDICMDLGQGLTNRLIHYHTFITNLFSDTQFEIPEEIGENDYYDFEGWLIGDENGNDGWINGYPHDTCLVTLEHYDPNHDHTFEIPYLFNIPEGAGNYGVKVHSVDGSTPVTLANEGPFSGTTTPTVETEWEGYYAEYIVTVECYDLTQSPPAWSFYKTTAFWGPAE